MFCTFVCPLKTTAACSKNMRVTSLNAGEQSCNVDFYSNIVYYIISPIYIMREIEKLILRIYSVIIYLGMYHKPTRLVFNMGTTIFATHVHKLAHKNIVP